jgi:hypothetical protein
MFTNTKTTLSVAVVLAVLGASSAALAGSNLDEGARDQRVEIGTGIVCDTQRQMERFVAFFDGDARAAVNAVNAEEGDPNACVFGTIAYVRGPDIATARTQSATFQIVRVIVVGILTDAGFRATIPASFFSVERVDERAA